MPFSQLTPRRFTLDAINMYAPVTSGVYGISNAREWIYIGETDNIQGSLLTHLRDPRTTLMKRDPTGFVFEICGQAIRSSRQDRLVGEYGPCCNGSTARQL